MHCAVRREERRGLGGVNVNGSELALGGVCVRGGRRDQLICLLSY